VAIKGYNIILDLLNSLIKFQFTIIKLYFCNKLRNIPSNKKARPYIPNSKETRPYVVNNKKVRPYRAIYYRKRYPKGSKNKPNIYIMLNDNKDIAYIEAFIT
jgi:hypothetical protein